MCGRRLCKVLENREGFGILRLSPVPRAKIYFQFVNLTDFDISGPASRT